MSSRPWCSSSRHRRKDAQEIAERDGMSTQIERLKAQIDKLRRMHFGRKSEQLERQIETLETQLEDLAAGRGVADVAVHAHVHRSSGLSATSPKREPCRPTCRAKSIVLEPDSACPKCDSAMQPLGEDVSEQLARVAAAFKVIRTIRRKLFCPCCGHIVQPPMPSLPIERSIAHPSLLADILVSKFADHQPLYRQSEIAARDGVTLDRGQHGPLGRAMRRALRAAG